MKANRHNLALFNFLYRRPFRVDILTAFTLVLVVTVSSIMWYSYNKSEQAVMQMTDNLIDNVSQIVMQRMTNYLMPASLMTAVIAQLGNDIDFNRIQQQSSLNEYMLQVVRNYEQISRFCMGDNDGNCIMVQKYADKTLELSIINRTTEKPFLKRIFYDAQGKQTETKISDNPDYDPRQRPWYQGAQKTHAGFWSDVYLFTNINRPGISSSYPIIDSKGQVCGVFSLDIELDSIANFLDEHPVSQYGTLFILNSRDEVVAYPELSLLFTREGDEIHLPRISDVSDTIAYQAVTTFKQSKREKFLFKFGGEFYVGLIEPFPKNFGNDWIVGITIKKNAFVGPLKTANYVIFAISFIILIIALFIASLISRSISKPIMVLTEETRNITNLCMNNTIPLKSHILEIQIIRDALHVMKTSLTAFNKYVPSALVRQLIQTGEEARIGGQLRELTIFFSDIEGFTSLAEHADPQELLVHMSEYLEALTGIVIEQKGTVDKYIGDALMAFWGAPAYDPDQAYNACRTALLCHRKVQELNLRWIEQGKAPLPTRFGIHTGDTVVGNIGCSERMNYSVLGDSVNVASRLERINKIYGTSIIVSQNTYDKVSDRFLFRELGSVQVKGKSEALNVYELVCENNADICHDTVALCERFNTALALFKNKKVSEAQAVFEKIHSDYPKDTPTGVYLQQCKIYDDEQL